MNPRNLAKALGVIVLGMGAFMLIPTLTALLSGESAQVFAWSSLGIMGLGGITLLAMRRHPANLSAREAILVVNLAWILLGLLGGLPFWLMQAVPSYADGIFEAISGFTTTGATVFSDIEALPNSLLIWRSTTHWLGGMGIIVFSIAILPHIGTGVQQLFRAETPGLKVEKLSPHIRDTAMALWQVYALLTALNAVSLILAGMSPFDALNHAFSTLATGGFSTRNVSMLAYAANDAIIWITILFMILAGLNFLWHFRAMQGDFRGFRSDEARLYIALILALSAGMVLARGLAVPGDWYPLIRDCVFSIISIVTTTGFAGIDYEHWNAGALIFIILAMGLGGTAGSTSGGVKIIRYVILVRTLRIELRRMIHPRAVSLLRIDDKPVPSALLTTVLGFFGLFFLTCLAVLVFLSLNGHDLTTALTTALATVGNIGPGLGQIGPMDNYAFYSGFEKLVLSLAMIIGRLECYTFFALLSREFWKSF